MAIKLVSIKGDLRGPDGTAPTSAILEIVPSKPFTAVDTVDGNHAVVAEGRIIRLPGTSPSRPNPTNSSNLELFTLPPTVSPVASPADASYLVKIKTVLNDPDGTTDTRQVKISYERWTIPDVGTLRFGDITRVVEPTTATIGDFVRKTGDSASGVISFLEGLNISPGKKLFLDGGSSVAFVYDATSQEVRLMIGSTIIAAWKA